MGNELQGVDPLLKWPGGKRWIAPKLADFVRPLLRGTYFEPFLGGGAVFFSLRPADAVLSDVNQELIETYKQIRLHPVKVESALGLLRVGKKDFYEIRAKVPSDPIARAARFLYLNRTAFGGIYRVNSCGQFNVPYGGGERTPEILIRKELIKSAAATLKAAKLLSTDFEDQINSAKAGDVVFCDPTYTVAHNKNAFVRYNEKNFSWKDQERLAAAAKAARMRGATVIVTNAAHDSLLSLYHPFRPIRVWRNSCVASDASRRRRVDEFVFALLPKSHAGDRKRLQKLTECWGASYGK